MSTSRRPDAVATKDVTLHISGHWRRIWVISTILLLSLVPSLQAQGNDAQRAIEKLEGCNEQERKTGCINILKRQAAGDDRQAIKAQVRGGRIIWYEYNKKTRSARRTN